MTRTRATAARRMALAGTLALGGALLPAGAGAAAAAPDMTLGPVVRTALPGCDNPTPVRAPDGAVYSNASDCSPASTRISTGWVRLEPGVQWVPSGLTAYGSGASGLKLSGALVEDGTLYLLERNLTRSGGMRLGRSASVAQPRVTWTGTLDFGWGSFATLSPDGYEYVYLRDARTAYGTADRVDLARVPKGSVADLAAWEVFAGGPTAPAWLPWADRDARAPVLTDPDRIGRSHVSYLDGCWTMAVTALPEGGLAVYTSPEPYGPWDRRYYAAGVDLGESAQFSPLWPGELLTTRGDRFEWRSYSMPGGC